METNTPKLKTNIRDITGKRVKKTRLQGLLPANLYGKEIKNINLTVDKKTFNKIYVEFGSSSLVDLIVVGEEKARKILIHEPQLHPVSNEPIHVDFYQVNMKEKIRTEVPIELVGVAPVVTDFEGNIITNKDSIQVECLPEDLIQTIELDISEIKSFDDVVHVKDLIVPAEIEVLDDPEDIVLTVTEPRSEEELEAELATPSADEEESAIAELAKEPEEEATENSESTEKDNK